MKNLKKFLLALTIVLGCATYNANAQIYVKIRPHRPHYERVVAPSPRHVWIDEEWEPRGSSYEFVGGHWVEPPAPGRVWISGSWAHGRRGHYWRAGHWGEGHEHHEHHDRH